MADDCKHPRGEGCAFCPDCGENLRHDENRSVSELRSFMRVASVLFPWGSEAQKWVERKIAEEKAMKVHMEPTPHILITQDQADAITKAMSEKRL